MKILAGLIAFVVLIVVGIALFVASHLNVLVEDVVETVGPEITETSVDLGSANINLLKGGGELNEFVIGNPKGFNSPYALKSEKFSLKVNPLALLNEVVEIDELIIQGVEIVVEQKGANTNIQSLLDTLSGPSSNSSSQTNSEDTTDVRLALKHLNFTDSSIKLVTENYGEYALEMPSFQLNNIGDPATGLTPEEFGSQVLSSLLKQAQSVAEDYIKGIAKEKFETEVKDKLEDELRKKSEEELGTEATDKAKKALKDIKKLF